MNTYNHSSIRAREVQVLFPRIITKFPVNIYSRKRLRLLSQCVKIFITRHSHLRLNRLLSFRRGTRGRKEEGADRRKWRLSRNVSSHEVAPDIWSNNNTNFVYRGNLLSGRCVYSGCSPFIVRKMHACAGVGMCETCRFHGLHLFRQ